MRGKARRSPFAFPLCRDALCNASTIVTDYTPRPNFFETTYTVIRMLRQKEYYLEAEWVKREMDGQTPEMLFIGEVKDEKWLMEALDLDWEQLLDFIADACLRFLKEVGERRGISRMKPVKIVSSDEEEVWEVVSIDLDRGELIIKDEYGRQHAHPIPSDIGPYTDATVGNTGANWWAVIRGCALNFLSDYYIWLENDTFADMINKRISSSMRLLVYYVDVEATEIKITGNETTFYTDEGWEAMSPLEVRVVHVGSVYFPVYVSSRYRHIFLSLLYEGFQQDVSDRYLYYALRSSRHYLYYRPGSSIAFIGEKGNKTKVSMKAHEDGVKLMLGEDVWIRLLLITREGVIMPHLAIQTSKYKGKEPEDFALLKRWRFPTIIIKLLLERVGSA